MPVESTNHVVYELVLSRRQKTEAIGFVIGLPGIFICMTLCFAYFAVPSTFNMVLVAGSGILWGAIFSHNFFFSIDQQWFSLRIKIDNEKFTKITNNNIHQTRYWSDLSVMSISSKSIAFQFNDGLKVVIWRAPLRAHDQFIQRAIEACKTAGIEDRIHISPLLHVPFFFNPSRVSK